MSMFGIEIPKIELPPLDQLKMHLSPALSVKWADADGVYSKSISPFPLSTQLLGDPQQTMVSATTVSAISAAVVPMVQKARAQAANVQVMNQEKQILVGLMMYATDHHGQLPPDLGTLVSDGEIPPSGLNVFLNPNSNTKLPAEILNGTQDKQAAWVNDNTDYKLLVAGKKLADLGQASEVAALVPKDAEHSTVRVPVGFADGHVETCTPRRVKGYLHPEEN